MNAGLRRSVETNASNLASTFNRGYSAPKFFKLKYKYKYIPNKKYYVGLGIIALHAGESILLILQI